MVSTLCDARQTTDCYRGYLLILHARRDLRRQSHQSSAKQRNALRRTLPSLTITARYCTRVKAATAAAAKGMVVKYGGGGAGCDED
jgi:hypothetical protein